MRSVRRRLFSIASTIVFARLEDAQKEFGPIRAMATLGWMTGCWVVSALGADTSALAGYSGAVAWVLVAGFTFFLPELETPKSAQHLTWHERLGPGRAHALEESRPPRSVHHLGAVLHSAGGLLSLCAAAPAPARSACAPARG